MKNGNKNKTSGITKVLLGLAVAGALLFASCQDIFDTSAQTPKDNDGYGYVVVDFGDSARTAQPATSTLTDIVYTFKAVDMDVSVVYQTPNTDLTPFRLPAGKYKLEVSAYVNFANIAGKKVSATGVYDSGDGTFQIAANAELIISVKLTPAAKDSDVNDNVYVGTLEITIQVPTGGGLTVNTDFKLNQLLGTGLLDNTPISLGNPTDTTSGSIKTSVYSIATLAPGTYLLTGRINTSDARYGGFSEAVHIVPFMTTTFARDFTAEDELSKVTSTTEAVAILKAEIASWITDNDALAVGDNGIDTTTDGKIRLNYVLTRTLLGAGSAFPIVLQGGWATDPATGAWNVGNSDGVTTVNLVNTAVKNNAGTGAPDTKYVVELWPVAEYTLSFGTTDTANRTVTIKDNGDGASGATITSDAAKTVTGIGVVGSTDITITNAAITIDGDFAAPNAAGLYNIANATSRAYDIKIYETVGQQTTAAFTRLRDEIATDWVVQKTALARVNPQVNSASGSGNTGTGSNNIYGEFDTVTLYYVGSRVTGTTFNINLPTDDNRWSFVGDWNLTTTPYANAGDLKTVRFKAYGGDHINYFVKLVPVAEFYVNYADAEPDKVPTTSKVIIKDAATTAPVTNEFTPTSNTGKFNTFTGDDKYLGFRYILGNTNIALTDATIMLDLTTEETDFTTADNFENFYKTPSAGGAGWVNTDVVDTSKDITAGSREYHIKVYRSIAKQKLDAQAEIREETQTALWTTGLDANNTKLNGGIAKVSPDTDLTSRLIYAGTEPVISIRNDYVSSTGVGKDFGAKGWTNVNTPNTADTNGNGNKTVTLSFTPKGGVEEDGIYKIKLIPAALYTVTFKKLPTGGNSVTGAVTVSGSDFGVTTLITPTPSYSATTTDPVFVGVGANITFTPATTGNLNVISGDAGSTYQTTAFTVSTPITSSVTPINVDVYPSVKDQQDNVFASLKAVRRLEDWGTLETVQVNPATGANAATDANTGFYVVVATIPNLASPAGLLDASYTAFTIANDGAVANGNKAVTVKFSPLGGTATDDKTYTFNLTQVAKYNVVFMNGPTGIGATGNVQVKTFKPGTPGNTAANADEITYSVAHNENASAKTFLGGIGNFTATLTPPIDTNAGKPTISSDNGNVFSIDLTEAGTFNTAGTTPVDYETAVTSRVYTIRVYPTVADQTTQIVNKLKTITSTTGWFSNPANINLQPNILTHVTGDKAEVQYWGPEPLVNATLTTTPLALQSGAGYDGYALAAGNAGSENGNNVGVKLVPLNFTAIGGAVSSPVYNLRTIPMAKYTVDYSNGAIGTITVTPLSTSKPGKPIVINASTPDKVGYAGLGSTTIAISAESTGQYDMVIIRNAAGDTLATLTPPTATAPTSNVYNLTPSTQAYSILVVKIQS